MTESAESYLPTLVKPRSTWVITSKTSPVNPNEPLDQVSTHPWSTLGVRAARPPPPRGQGRGPPRAGRPWNASRIYRVVPLRGDHRSIAGLVCTQGEVVAVPWH
jgi:hypothetical protein